MTDNIPISTPTFLDNGVLLPESADFDFPQTLDCGQAFRWVASEDGSYSGVAGKKVCHISHLDNGILLGGVSRADYEDFWRTYFDLDRDYTALKEQFSEDPILARAISFAPGIRVLRQDPWEALCSFIISQNNNIKRIKGIVERLCETFGEKLYGEYYTFPEPGVLAELCEDDLAPLRSGFRARYILDAARQISVGNVSFDGLESCTLEEGRARLTRIVGVGVKVADCTLLYGCGRTDAFPIDVWIRRVMQRLYPNGLPKCALEHAGIAQQYLFHYARTCPEVWDDKKSRV